MDLFNFIPKNLQESSQLVKIKLNFELYFIFGLCNESFESINLSTVMCWFPTNCSLLCYGILITLTEL